MTAAAAAVAAEPKQEKLSLVIREEPPSSVTETKPHPVVANTANATLSPADELLRSVRGILSRELAEPCGEADIAKLLAITKPQAKAWLAKLVKEGVLEKAAKPVRYRTAVTADRLL